MKPEEILGYCREQQAIKAAAAPIKKVTRLLKTQEDIKELKATLENRLNQLSKDDDDVKLALTRFVNGFELDEIKFEKPEFYFKWEKPIINWIREIFESPGDAPAVILVVCIALFILGISPLISGVIFPSVLLFPSIYLLRCLPWKKPIK